MEVNASSGCATNLWACGMDPEVTAPLLAPILGLAPCTGYEPVQPRAAS